VTKLAYGASFVDADFACSAWAVIAAASDVPLVTWCDAIPYMTAITARPATSASTA
jgi:hypothetical protein